MRAQATGAGEVRLARQEQVHAARAAAPVGDRPDDQRLAALHVAGREDRRHARHPVRVSRDGAAIGHRTPNCSSSPVRSGPVNPIASSTRSACSSNGAEPGDRLEDRAARHDPAFDVDRAQRRDVARRVADEALGRDGKQPLASLLVRGGDAEDLRPLRPRVARARGCRAGAAAARADGPTRRPGGAPCRDSRRRCRRRR